MPYGVITDVPAPIEMYDKMHAEVARRFKDTSADGLLLHMGRPTEGGFQSLDVYESEEAMERYGRLLAEIAADVFGAEQPSGAPPATTVFEVRGLVIPRGDIWL